MTNRKFYKSVLTIEVISEAPLPPSMCIGEIVDSYSVNVVDGPVSVLNGEQAAKALREQNSDPSFFNLDDAGNDVEL